MGYNGLPCRIEKYIFDATSIFIFLFNVQNERVANISDVVRRGLGMLPQQAEQAILKNYRKVIFQN